MFPLSLDIFPPFVWTVLVVLEFVGVKRLKRMKFLWEAVFILILTSSLAFKRSYRGNRVFDLSAATKSGHPHTEESRAKISGTFNLF